MTCTNIGKRELRHRLLFPIMDTNELNIRYNIAEYFIENNDKLKIRDSAAKI